MVVGVNVHEVETKYKAAARAAATYAKAYGVRPLFAILEKFGADGIYDVAPENVTAFIAACWTNDSPRIRRVK
jgi:hypothetical protein